MKVEDLRVIVKYKDTALLKKKLSLKIIVLSF